LLKSKLHLKRITRISFGFAQEPSFGFAQEPITRIRSQSGVAVLKNLIFRKKTSVAIE